MIRSTVALAALALAAAPVARAADSHAQPSTTAPTAANNVSVGFGVGIEPLGLIGLSPNANPFLQNGIATPGADFFVPIQIGQQLRIEPSIGFRHQGFNGGSTNAWGVGVGGLFFLQPTAPTGFYAGGRIKVAHFSESQDTAGGTLTNSATDFTLAPVFGAEYAFAPRFTFGAELQLPITWYGNPSGSNRDETGISTNVMVFLRYFFL